TAASRHNYTTLRAMSQKIPVIANPGVNDDFCMDGQTCRVFKRGQPDMLSAALAEILAHPAAARELALHAAMNLQRHYGMSDSVLRLIAVCRQAAGIPLAMSNAVRSGK
ncbi:MAG: glycosyltransferase, partial [Phycisphaerae bacterium]